MISPQSRKSAGILLFLLPTVIYRRRQYPYFPRLGSPYAANRLRQDLWRAGNAHAGVLLLLSLIVFLYLDHAALPSRAKTFVRIAVPTAAFLLSLGFFLSVLTPDASDPNDMIYFAYPGALILAEGLIVLGIGLIRIRTGTVQVESPKPLQE